MSRFEIRRRIEIDAGHRIMTHGSKCRHLHGHRYVVEAICHAVELAEVGEQTAMVLDFGFLKDAMVEHIDRPCDHGLIVSEQDAELLEMLAPKGTAVDDWIATIRHEIARAGFATTNDTRLRTKLYVMSALPTAEALAEHWYCRLAPDVRRLSGERAILEAIAVHETPNCAAEYRPGTDFQEQVAPTRSSGDVPQ